MQTHKIIEALFTFSDNIRYVAIYSNHELSCQQRETNLVNTSSGESDKYEELLVNPVILKLASQRGRIDCGGLHYLLVGYGHFFQLIKNTDSGHISICLDKTSDLNNLPAKIFTFLNENFSDLGLTNAL